MSLGRGICLAAIAIACLAAPGPAAGRNAGQVEIHVRLDGRDAPLDRIRPGASTIGPYRTLHHALAAVGVLRERPGGKARPIRIVIGPGKYRLKKRLKLTHRHSGRSGAPLSLTGAGIGRTIISGSEPLHKAPALSATVLRRIPKAGRPAISAYKMPRWMGAIARIDLERIHLHPSIPVPFELFTPTSILHPARWPNAGWARIAALPNGESGKTIVVAPTGAAPRKDARTRLTKRLSSWMPERDLWAGGYWNWDWTYETFPIVRVAPRSAVLILSQPPKYDSKVGGKFVVYHALSELDAPGEWYRDMVRGRIYVYPPEQGGLERENSPPVTVSRAVNGLLLEGASHVKISGITLEEFRGDGIAVRGGDDIVLSRIRIHRVGGRAIVFDGARNSGVRYALIEDAGEGGVVLKGGERHTLSQGGLFVENSRIVRFSRLGRTSRPGVRIAGVGNRVIGNFIADAPQSAILFSGNDHRIEGNEIARVMLDASDGGAIYTGRDWTSRGTVIEGNFLHDIAFEQADGKGVYIDDLSGDISVKGNIFLRVSRPVFIGGGSDIVVANNLFIRSEPAIHFDARGLTWDAKAISDRESEMHRNLRAVPYRSAIWRARYPGLAKILEDNPAVPKRNIGVGNLFIASRPYLFEPPADPALQFLEEAVSASPPPDSEINDSLGQIGEAETARDVARFLKYFSPGAGVKKLPFHLMDRQRLLRVGPTGTLKRNG